MQKKSSNKIISENRLFWFLKKRTKINLQDNVQLDLYIQQILIIPFSQILENALKKEGLRAGK